MSQKYLKTIFLNSVVLLFSACTVAFSANVGMALYGLPRFNQASVTRVAEALVEACRSPMDPKKWVKNCRVEFSWLVTFSAAPAVETTNTETVAKYVISRLPPDAILTVTTALGFHSNEEFLCSDLTSNSRDTANKLDDIETHGKFTIPSYKTRVDVVTQMIRGVYADAGSEQVIGVQELQDRHGMLKFVIIPHLEDRCSAVQYKYLRDWLDGPNSECLF